MSGKEDGVAVDNGVDHQMDSLIDELDQLKATKSEQLSEADNVDKEVDAVADADADLNAELEPQSNEVEAEIPDETVIDNQDTVETTDEGFASAEEAALSSANKDEEGIAEEEVMEGEEDTTQIAQQRVTAQQQQQSEPEPEQGQQEVKRAARHDSISSTRSGQSIGTKSFKSWFNIKLKSANGSTASLDKDIKRTEQQDEEQEDSEMTELAGDLLNEEANYDLLLYRLRDTDLKSKQNVKNREQYRVGSNSIKITFNEIKQGIHHAQNETLMSKIDWEFWSKVVDNYTEIATNESVTLKQKISDGIPNELRGMVWQLIATSKNPDLEELFRNLKIETSQHERAIKRDLARTRFMNNSTKEGGGEIRDKQQEVFEIIKAYSLYDPEVGYTQGMAFITAPLLMNMSESESFCLLVALMKNYEFRSLYLPEMPGLVLKLYQFDRLLEDNCPELFYHLQRQGIRSSMYATQWFLTLFGYKFPLEMVLRIYDIVIAEGMESILKFAINLMLQNKDHLVTMTFDELLNFLKDDIFQCYLEGTNKASAEEEEEGVIINYKLDELVHDSMNTRVLPIMLQKYEQEFQEVHRMESERQDEIDNLRNKNGQLTMEIRKLEKSYSLLNKEHVEIANEMIQGKMRIATLEDENKSLKENIETLTANLAEIDSAQQDGHGGQLLQKDIDEEIQKTMQRNLEVMETNRLLEEQLGQLELNYSELNKKYDALNNDHGNLKSRLRNLMG